MHFPSLQTLIAAQEKPLTQVVQPLAGSVSQVSGVFPSAPHRASPNVQASSHVEAALSLAFSLSVFGSLLPSGPVEDDASSGDCLVADDVVLSFVSA